MSTLIWGKTFIKAFSRTAKKHPSFRMDIERTLRQLTIDPFSAELETHKLEGKLSGNWACTFEYDLRIVFEFVKDENGKDTGILLIEIGSHDEVY